MKFKTRFTATRFSQDPNVHADTGEICKSLTRQEHKEECDINSILAKYERTGELPPGRQPRYVHCDALTFQESLAIVQRAEDAFNELPARIRDQYGNDPVRFLEAFEKRDPKLIEAALENGLISERSPDALQLLKEVASNTKPKEAAKAGAGTGT